MQGTTTTSTSDPITTGDHSAELAALRDRLNRAETAEEIAEICRLEAEIMGGPFWCPACGVQLTSDDTAPCRMDHDQNSCGVIRFGLNQ